MLPLCPPRDGRPRPSRCYTKSIRIGARTRTIGSIALSSALFLVAPIAHADDTAPSESSPAGSDVATAKPEQPRRWYGWQTLLVDGASLAVLTAAGLSLNESHDYWSSNAAVYPGLAGYTLGPPIVHAARDHWGKAGASFGVRAASLGLLTLGVVECLSASGRSDTWSGDRDSSDDGGCTSNPIFWFGVGAIPAAIALDAALIAREYVPSSAASSLRFSPWVDAKNRGGGLSFGSAF
jgi:hypothetical protein